MQNMQKFKLWIDDETKRIKTEIFINSEFLDKIKKEWSNEIIIDGDNYGQVKIESAKELEQYVMKGSHFINCECKPKLVFSGTSGQFGIMPVMTKIYIKNNIDKQLNDIDNKEECVMEINI